MQIRVRMNLAAKNIVGFVPKILIAPEYTHTRTAAVGQTPATSNPVVAELIGIAERLKAVIIADIRSELWDISI